MSAEFVEHKGGMIRSEDQFASDAETPFIPSSTLVEACPIHTGDICYHCLAYWQLQVALMFWEDEEE